MNKHTDKNENFNKQFLDAYDNYAENILRHASLRVSDKSVAEDITSETFLKAWDYVRKNNEVKNFKGFLYKIADNLIIDYYRTKKHQTVSIETVEEIHLADQTDIAEEIDRALSFENIREHLESLPEDHKSMLIYRYVDELNISEIKNITGKSITNIYVIIHRALKILRKKIVNKDDPSVKNQGHSE